MSAQSKTWQVEGMHCPHCETVVRRALENTKGIRNIQADWQKGTLTALWDESVLPEAEIESILRNTGYTIVRRSPKRERAVSAVRLLLLITLGTFLYFVLTRTSASRWMQTFPMAREGMGFGMLFLIGVATSLHCVAMCGGINMAQSTSSAKNGIQPSRANLLYNLGRLVSYTIVGAIVGGIGMVFSLTSSAKAIIQILAAAFMLIMAANLFGGFSWLQSLMPRLPEGLQNRVFGKVAGRSSFFIGLANGLMPCGPLQAMQLYALAAGSWLKGALSMFFFCLGTVPLMLGFGLASGTLMRRFAKPMRLVSSLLVLVMGINALASGFALAGIGNVPAGKSSQAEGTAVLEDGVQVVYSELDWGGYPIITVQEGIPVKWTLHAEEDRLTSCNNELYIPAYDLSVKLQPGDNVIEFIPDKPGTIPYTCWMGMIRSTIFVEEEL